MKQHKVFLLFLLILGSFIYVSGTRTSKKIYFDVSGNSACFRRFNATHQIGCNSEIKGNVGIVHYITSEDDFDWVINKGPNQPYAVLLGSQDFNSTNVQRLRQSGRINGIMVIHVVENETLTPFPEQFSPDKTCPNDQYGLYNEDSNYGNCKEVEWNSHGNNLMFEDFNFPIFILTNQTEVDFLINDCYEKYNKPVNGSAREYPLCAVELKERMSGAKDSPTCIRRTQVPTNLNPDTYCDPLGDKNVAATFKAVLDNETYPEDSVIVAAARLDSFSLFENTYPSADNHVTGIVGLLAAAEALGKVKDSILNKSESKDILFAFFQGEAFDYIGSTRMLYEMENGNFPALRNPDKNTIVTLHPITINHISHFVEVNQLGYRDKDKLWIHTDPLSRKMGNISQKIDDMVASIKKISEDVNVSMDSVGQTKPLPPASVQRFLKKRKIPSIVITDHEGQFTNRYYNSRFDIAREINATSTNDTSDIISEQAKMLANVSTVIARFLFNLSTGENPPDGLEADVTSVNSMLYCFLVSRKCELFRQIIEPEDKDALEQSDETYPFYVSVATTSNHVTELTKNLLSFYLGDHVNVTKDNCRRPNNNNKAFQYVWMQGPQSSVNSTERPGICIKSTANTSVAKSPAFDIEDYDWNSGKYSSWTESSWQADAISVRVFLVPSEKMQVAIFCSGSIVLIFSLLFVYLLQKKSDILFDTEPNDSSTPN